MNGIVLKTSSASELISAIRSVLLGESYLCSRIALIRKKSHCTSTVLQSKDIPTKREQDVLQAVAKGLNTHEIAHLLGISENTVETFRKKLLSKFGAKNAIDLVVKAVSQGWVSVQ
ncbi:response regulator transcription factor [Bacteroides eggerthii]|uniref:response regulator transcription factor n=1 Tax=Bacteroides eggerthii TaxID=28111 RepID=UPI001E2C2976|nr:response regulator transcription factor [Bacteroides eggerthii]